VVQEGLKSQILGKKIALRAQGLVFWVKIIIFVGY